MSSKSIVIILCLLASIGVIWQLVLPKYDKINALNQEISQIELKVQKLENLDAKLKDFAKTYKEKQDLIDKLYRFMPRGKDVPNILSRFEALSFQSGMILNSIDFAEVESKKTTTAQIAPESEAGKTLFANEQTTGQATSAGIAAISQAIESAPKAISLSFKISGTYDSFRGFLDNLENCTRLSDVQSIDFSFKSETSDLADFNIVTNVYYK